MNKLISILKEDKYNVVKQKITYKNIYKLEKELMNDFYETKDTIKLLELVFLNKDFLINYCNNRLDNIKNNLRKINNEKNYILNNKFVDNYHIKMLEYRYLYLQTNIDYYKYLINNLNDKINILKKHFHLYNLKYESNIKKDYKKLIYYFKEKNNFLNKNLDKKIEDLKIKKMIFENHLYLLENYYEYLYDTASNLIKENV